MKWEIETLKPVAIAWTATMVMLLIYLVYNAFINKDLGGIIGVIFFASLVIYGVSELIHRKKK